MDRYDPADTHLVFEGISTGIDNKFGLEAVFYGMGFLSYIVVVLLFIDLFFTSITSPIFYGLFAPNRKRRRRAVSLQQASTESSKLEEFFAKLDESNVIESLERIVDSIELYQREK